MNLTLDGYLSGLNCELDWHFKFWDNEMASIVCDNLSDADTILLGRKTYCAMQKHWPKMLTNHNLAAADVAFALMMNEYKKFVISQTLKTADWKNTSILNADLSECVNDLKSKKGKNIMLYGSGKTVQSLMKFNLVDEYQLYIHPVFLGAGKLLFTKKLHKNILHIKSKRLLKSGVALIYYRV